VDLFHRQSPLFVAAYNGDYEAVSLLLGFGATQNGCSNEDRLLIHDGFLRDSPTEEWKIRPPLDGAVRVGHLRIVKPLIEHTGCLASCPFHWLDLGPREPSPELMKIFQTLHIRKVYTMNEPKYIGYSSGSIQRLI
jgi:hypothetical protein